MLQPPFWLLDMEIFLLKIQLKWCSSSWFKSWVFFFLTKGVATLGYIISEIGYCISNLRKGRETMEKDLSIILKMRKHYNMNDKLLKEARSFIINNKHEVDQLYPAEEKCLLSKFNEELRNSTFIAYNRYYSRKPILSHKIINFFYHQMVHQFSKSNFEETGTYLIFSQRFTLPTKKQRKNLYHKKRKNQYLCWERWQEKRAKKFTQNYR